MHMGRCPINGVIQQQYGTSVHPAARRIKCYDHRIRGKYQLDYEKVCRDQHHEE
jgi:hypothetical protein